MKHPSFYRVHYGNSWLVYAWRSVIEETSGIHSRTGGAIIDKIETSGWTKEQINRLTDSGEAELHMWQGTAIELGRHMKLDFSDELQLVEQIRMQFLKLRERDKSTRSALQNNVRPIESFIVDEMEVNAQEGWFHVEFSNFLSDDNPPMPLREGDIIQLGEWIGGVGGFRRGVEAEAIITESRAVPPDRWTVSFRTMGVILETINNRRSQSRKIVKPVNEKAKLTKLKHRVDSMPRVDTTVDRQISLDDDE